MIDFIVGQESRYGDWGIFHVEGLKNWVKNKVLSKEIQLKHPNFKGYVGCNIPEGVLFTVFEKSGDRTDCCNCCKFFICVTTNQKAEYQRYRTKYSGPGSIEGRYRVIAQGLTEKKALLLMTWWMNSRKP